MIQKLNESEVYIVLQEIGLLPKSLRVNFKDFFIEKMKCIFHNENTASLSINKKTGNFKCFGCGKSGSIFDLYAEVNNISKKESFVEILKRFGKYEEDEPVEKIVRVRIKISKTEFEELKKKRNSDLERILRLQRPTG